MSEAVVQKALGILQKKLVRTARCFHDYNFREFFIQKAKEDIAAVQKLPLEEQCKYVKGEGAEQLKQMKRMVMVNQMYSSQPASLGDKAGTWGTEEIK